MSRPGLTLVSLLLTLLCAAAPLRAQEPDRNDFDFARGQQPELRVYTAEEMRANMEWMLQEVDWFTRAYVDLPPGLAGQVAAAQAALDEIPPEAMERLGPIAGAQTEAVAAQMAHMRQRLLARVAAATREPGDDAWAGGRGMTKSAGFPEALTSLPEYEGYGPGQVEPDSPPDCCPYITDGRCIRNGYFSLDAAGNEIPFPRCEREEPPDVDSEQEPRPISGCNMILDADGRIERLAIEDEKDAHDAAFAMEILNAIMDSVCGGFSGGPIGFSCDLCCMPFRVAGAVADGMVRYNDLCEGEKAEAELEAAMHYSRSSYEGIEHVHDDLEDLQASLVVVEETLAEVQQCVPAPELRLGSGSNGIDDDCNGVIDDPREDVFPPTLHVDEAVSAVWYSSTAEAIAAVERATLAFDDSSRVTVLPPVLSGACGSVIAALSAADDSGNAAGVETLVHIDAEPPTVSISGGLAGSCLGSIAEAEAAVLASAILSDDCTPAGELELRVDTAATPCAVRIRLTATDASGKSGSDAVTVRVDTAPPAVSIERLLLGFRGEVLGFQTPPCFESVAEAEAAVAAVTSVSDDCTPASGLPVRVNSSGDPCSLTVAVAAGDSCTAENSDEVTVRVDDAPPIVNVSVEQSSLWPPNHEMIDVGFSTDATDNCSAAPEIAVRVTSDERSSTDAGGGGSAHGPDAEILRGPDGSIEAIRLRAERAGQNGRVYRIEVEATDACGRTGSSSVTVTVPKTPNTDAVDDGQYFDATAVN